ncbi:unnamed protein product [Symbiodinium natans]|uniref:JmjC domain-containing protein n=1 Tax=Symbiodinium natans TaxID=878477 RepID=A0A812IC86_9DINO|nr:unnamed protein product [Symbiodinium natans]
MGVDVPVASWWPLDADGLEAARQRWVELFPSEALGAEEIRRFYGRPISDGEVGVFLSHRAAWTTALSAPFTLILEDDAVPMSFLPPAGPNGDVEEESEAAFFRLCAARWASVWTALTEAGADLGQRGPWDMLLVGRHRFGEDRPVSGEHDLVEAGFSTCLHAYVVTRHGAERLLALTAHSDEDSLGVVIPIDDLLPGRVVSERYFRATVAFVALRVACGPATTHAQMSRPSTLKKERHGSDEERGSLAPAATGARSPVAPRDDAFGRSTWAGTRAEKPAAGLATADFRRLFEALPGAPVVLEGATDLASPHGGSPWPTSQQLSNLRASLASRECRCHLQEDALALTSGRTKLSVIRLPFDKYLHYMDTHEDAEPLYLFQEFDPDIREAVDKDFRAPSIFAEDFLLEAEEPPEGFVGLDGWLLVGPERSGSRWHFDPWGTAAWNLLFEGEKLWAMAPPTGSPPGVEAQTLESSLSGESARRYYAAPPALAGLLAALPGSPNAEKLLWAVQQPGDLVFIPSGWWHCTVSLSKTVAYTRNYINSHNFLRAQGSLSSLHPAMAAQLKRWIWRLHMDEDEEEGDDRRAWLLFTNMAMRRDAIEARSADKCQAKLASRTAALLTSSSAQVGAQIDDVNYSWMVTCNSDNEIVVVSHFAPGCMGTSDGTDRQSGTYTPNLAGCTNPMWMEGRASMNATLDAGDCGTTTTTSTTTTTTTGNDTTTTGASTSAGAAATSGSSGWGNVLPNLVAMSFLAMC